LSASLAVAIGLSVRGIAGARMINKVDKASHQAHIFSSLV
jgi:hypothetical protein